MFYKKFGCRYSCVTVNTLQLVISPLVFEPKSNDRQRDVLQHSGERDGGIKIGINFCMRKLDNKGSLLK